MPKGFTQEEAETKCLENGYGWPEGFVYKNRRTKYPLICLTCGDNRFKFFGSVGKANGKCQSCNISAKALTHEEAVDRGLAAKHPALLLEEYKGYHVKHVYRFLRCKHEHEIRAYALDDGQGCGACWFDPGPTYVYFMQHEGFNAYKIGITRIDQEMDRVFRLAYKGWTLVHKVEYETREEAEAVEKAVLYSWRHFPAALTPEQMPNDGGYGETVSRVYVKEADVISVMSDLALV